MSRIAIDPASLRVTATAFAGIGSSIEGCGLRSRRELSQVRVNPADPGLNLANLSIQVELVVKRLIDLGLQFQEDAELMRRTAREGEHADADLVLAIEDLSIDLEAMRTSNPSASRAMAKQRQQLLLELADGNAELAAILAASADGGRLFEFHAYAVNQANGVHVVDAEAERILDEAGEPIGGPVYQEMLALALLVEAATGERPTLIERAYPAGSGAVDPLAGDDSLLVLEHFLATYGWPLGDPAGLAGRRSTPEPVRQAAQYLVANPGYVAKLGGADTTAGELAQWQEINAEIREHVLANPDSWTGAHALAFNRHVFAHDPEAAVDFVVNLPGTQDDLSGASAGVDFLAVGSEGFQATAGAALIGADDLVEEVVVASRLPETANADRNSLFNLYYGRLAREMNVVLNPTSIVADPLDPTSTGHSGNNWAHFGASASHEVGPIISGEKKVAKVLTPSLATRQQTADGNQWIFGTIAPAYAAMIEQQQANPGPMSEAELEDFLGSRAAGRPILPNGSAELRDGMVYYLAAAATEDPVERQRLTFLGSGLMGTYEQGGINGYLDRIWDLSIADDGVVQGIGEPFAALIGGDRAIATSLAEVRLGIDEDAVVYPLTKDIAVHPPGGSRIANLELGSDLNPAAAENQLIDMGDYLISRDPSIELTGEGDIVLDPMFGFVNPDPSTGLEPFPGSTVEWSEVGGSEMLNSMGGPLFEDTVEREGYLNGTGAIDWSDPNARMNYIANWFHQLHGDPTAFESVDDFTVDHSAPWLPATAADRFES